jgi:uncharacterized membrane protein
MADVDQSGKQRMSSGLRIVLVVSLALNLLVIGAVGGALYRFGGLGDRAAEAVGTGRALYRALPHAERRALRRDLRQALDREALRTARIGPQLDSLLRAESFDADAVNALLVTQAQALQTGQAVMRAGWLDVVAGMSQAERIAYADRLKEVMSRRKPPRD